jgi:hypothetical protein
LADDGTQKLVWFVLRDWNASLAAGADPLSALDAPSPPFEGDPPVEETTRSEERDPDPGSSFRALIKPR